jgi:heavy metal translocating P-type ATPase
MTRFRSVVKRYPLVAGTLAIGVVGLSLLALDLEVVAAWIVSLFALAVAVREGWHMARNLLRGQVGLDILAVTAILATVIVGEFWASLVIVLMLSGGEALEDLASVRARRELNALLTRVPQRAHRIADDGEIEEVRATEVAVGDRLLLRPAELVPVDAELLSSGASFDESSLTGESMPVEKAVGDLVLSGSLNGATAVEVRATALASDSQYQRIVALVEEASQSKAPLVRLADRYALPFTVVSLIIAGVAWAVSGDPVRFAEVLVVATPCPLLIAAPVAFMAGMSSAAKRGIVVKDAGTIEKLSRARTVAFDKTGTLTHGRPEVTGVQPAGGFSENRLLQLVGSAEQYSSHVLAQSLVTATRARDLPLLESDDAAEVATNGVSATLDGHAVLVGKPGWVERHASGVERLTLGTGEAAVYVAVDGRFAGTVTLRDRIRDEAAATFAALGGLGVRKMMMLTGDAEPTAAAVAASLGIERVHAELLPIDKVEIVREAAPRPVVMVGDGVNDAPVLAAADVGIALGARGSTAASESADVVILVDDLSRVARAVSIGHRTVAIALQSIWVGIVISVGLMFVAAFGFLPAIAGAALQEVVDLVAILGALRAVRAGVAPLRGLSHP